MNRSLIDAQEPTPAQVALLKEAQSLENKFLSQTLGFNTMILAGNVGSSSRQVYARGIYAYLAFAQAQQPGLDPLDSGTLAKWRNHLVLTNDYSPNTILTMMSAVRNLMVGAADMHYISWQHAEEFKHIRGVKVEAMKENLRPHNKTQITPEQMRAMTQLPDQPTLRDWRNIAMLHTLASSGLRVNTFRLLKKEQILKKQHGYELFVLGKNIKEATPVPLSEEAYEAIQIWLDLRPVDSDYIFTSFKHKAKKGEDPPLSELPMASRSVWEIVKAYGRRVGLEYVKTHDFRRFMISVLLAMGEIEQAKLAALHKNVQTTLGYSTNQLREGLTNKLY